MRKSLSAEDGSSDWEEKKTLALRLGGRYKKIV